MPVAHRILKALHLGNELLRFCCLWGELGGIPASTAVIEKIYVPHKTKQAQIFEGDAKTAAAQLVEKLKFEVRVI